MGLMGLMGYMGAIIPVMFLCKGGYFQSVREKMCAMVS